MFLAHPLNCSKACLRQYIPKNLESLKQKEIFTTLMVLPMQQEKMSQSLFASLPDIIWEWVPGTHPVCTWI